MEMEIQSGWGRYCWEVQSMWMKMDEKRNSTYWSHVQNTKQLVVANFLHPLQLLQYILSFVSAPTNNILQI